MAKNRYRTKPSLGFDEIDEIMRAYADGAVVRGRAGSFVQERRVNERRVPYTEETLAKYGLEFDHRTKEALFLRAKSDQTRTDRRSLVRVERDVDEDVWVLAVQRACDVRVRIAQIGVEEVITESLMTNVLPTLLKKAARFEEFRRFLNTRWTDRVNVSPSDDAVDHAAEVAYEVSALLERYGLQGTLNISKKKDT